GRAWLAYWLAPYPSLNLWMWPQFRSPLLWDVFAVSTYGTVSLLFWYMGMVPDLATFRDRSKNKFRRMAYGILSLGWSGSSRHWMRYEKAYALLAAFAAPLVLSVHTIVSFDFAVSQVPGWHTTIFPPYFVAGAIFSGFAMVLTLMIPARKMLGLEQLITIRHLDNMCKIILATGSIVGLAYGTEFFIAWYGQVQEEKFAFLNRAFGPYWWAYWTMISCNVISPQLFWIKKFRTTPWIIVIISIFVNIGMWFERFVIVITSLSRDYLPSAWAYFSPTWVDWSMLIGSFGLFFTLFLLFCRLMPVINMAETKSTLAKQYHMSHSDKH
ncbi:MAG: polysulfide reductase NrfD, partial [Rubripirellula sp.]|nr:polysulfide reductase NrfD [Rubripirellula sp.]